MVKKTSKTVFCCQACGYQTPKWMGKCPDCGSWDSFVEERAAGAKQRAARAITESQIAPVPIDSIDLETELRLLTEQPLHVGFRALDAVAAQDEDVVLGVMRVLDGRPGQNRAERRAQLLEAGRGDLGGRAVLITAEVSDLRPDRRSRQGLILMGVERSTV